MERRKEIIGGIVTFMSMAYIIFVQPSVLSQAGMDFGAVMMATCLSAAFATLMMGLYANYPIALAPGMGENFYFAFTVILGMGIAWQKALGAVFLSGVIFLILTLVGIRELIINAVPSSLKNAIAAGIGLFIAFIGLNQAGIVKIEGNIIHLGSMKSPPVLLTLFGLFLICVLMRFNVKGSILIGMLATAVLGIALGYLKFYGIVGKPPSISPTFLKLDIKGALELGFITIILVFLLMDMFDTAGTLIGVGQAAGFIKDGKLPRANRCLLTDAVGTILGALLGTSTVTSYIESATGVAQGARTGFASVITGLLFLISIFFYPLVKTIGGGMEWQGAIFYPVTAPALIIVGYYMAHTIKEIEWEDITEAIPAFLTLIGIPLTYSIADGMALGFISYCLIKLLTKKGKEVHPILYVFAGLFIFKYVIF